MKTVVIVMIAACCGIYNYGEAASTNSLPTRVGDAAGDLLGRVKGDIAGEMRRRMSAGSIDEKDVQDLLAKVTAASNAIAGSGLNQKLELAMRQLEKKQAEAAAALKNPDSKALLQFDVQPMLLRLGWLKAQNEVMLRQLADLAATLQEMAAWSKIMGQVFPEDQVGEKVKARLGQLAAQWEQSGSGPAREATNVVTDARITWTAPLSDQAKPPVEASSVGLSAGAFEVARMVHAGASEKEVLRYVSKSKAPFALTAGHIMHLRGQGVYNTLIVAILERDRALASRDNERGMNTSIATSRAGARPNR